MWFIFVLMCGTCVLYSTKAKDTSCAYHMKGSGTITHPGSDKSNFIPTKFHPLPSTEYCIAYGTVRWTQDMEIRMINSTNKEVQMVIHARESHPLKVSTVPVITTTGEFFGFIASMEGLSPLLEIYTLSNTTTLRGNETAQFTIAFARNSNISISYRLKRKQRKFLCPSLETEFDVVSCTDGRNKHSECIFECKKNYGPTPLFYLTGNLKDYPEIDQLGKSLPKMSSVCSRTKDGRPIWSPDVIGWTAYSDYDLGTILHSTCMPYAQLATACIDFSETSSYFYRDIFNPCDNYPLDLLLEIYDQKSDVVYVEPTLPTTTQPQRPFDSISDKIGLENLNARERQFIMNQLRNWKRSCLEQLGLIENNGGADVGEGATPEAYEVLKKLSAFSEVCIEMPHIEADPNTVACGDYCRVKSGRYHPEHCGSFQPKRKRRKCMNCRIFRKLCTGDGKAFPSGKK